MAPVGLRQMNTFVLGKHHLAERVEHGDIVRVVNDVVALHAVRSTTPHLSLLARMEGVKQKDLEREMYERRMLAKVRCMRRTIHVLSRRMFPQAMMATQHLYVNRIDGLERYMGLTRERFREVSEEIMAAIPEEGWTTREAKAAVESDINLSIVINLMCDLGMLVRWRATGGWRSNIHKYVPMEAHFGDVDLGAVDIAEAQRTLMERYISAFGPVTVNDIAWWTGFKKTLTRKAIKTFGTSLARVEVEGLEGEHLLTTSQEDDLASHRPGRRRVVNLVPCQDPYMMGYRDRARYLAEEHRFLVFDRAGNSTNSILLDGRVIGVWDRVEKPSPLVKYHLFDKQPESVWKAIRREAKRIGRFITGSDVTVKERSSMVPLHKRTYGSFMHPLKDGRGRR